jgi:hypothetical protein
MNYLSYIHPTYYPAAAAATTFIAARAIVGSTGLGLKGASKIADYLGQNQIGESLNETGNHFLDFAKRNGARECQIVSSLMQAGTMAYIGSNILSSEANSIAPAPEASYFQKVSEYVGLTQPPTFSEELITSAERVATNVTETPSLMISAPFGTTLAGSLATRVAAGTLGGPAIAAGKTLNYVGLKGVGQPIANAGSRLMAFATRGLGMEIGVLNMVQFGKGMFYLGQGITNGVSAIYQRANSIAQTVL